ncbi:MAG TPA: MerR family transcriptional regulator [Geobacter sp.]|nr:MerR family transcriptional regulator [Geobacter sp.]
MRLSNEDHMQISDLAEKLGITTRTIRLYEKMELVDPPRRTDGRVRYYEKADVKRFKFVLKLKELGLSLEEMKGLADIYYREQQVPSKIMPRLIELLETHLKNIREKVSTLQSLEKDIAAYQQRIIDEYDLASAPASGAEQAGDAAAKTTAGKAKPAAAAKPPRKAPAKKTATKA